MNQEEDIEESVISSDSTGFSPGQASLCYQTRSGRTYEHWIKGACKVQNHPLFQGKIHSSEKPPMFKRVVSLFFLICLTGCTGVPAITSTPQPFRRGDGSELVFSYCDKPYCLKPTPSIQNPAFSPDGRLVLYTVFWKGYNQGSAGIYRLLLADGIIYPLLNESGYVAANVSGSSWNATTRRIAFASNRRSADEQWSEIWVVNDDGSYLHRVTSHLTPEDFIAPTFSPEGEWLVFEARPTANALPAASCLWKVRVNGADLTPLTADASADDQRPNWSPTGEWIVFQRRLPGKTDYDIYLMTPDGRQIQPLATSPADEVDAAWSPDGRWIVYSSTNGELTTPGLYLLPATGGTPQRLTHDDAHSDSAPTWSPDGRWIVFASRAVTEPDLPTTLWRIAVPELPLR